MGLIAQARELSGFTQSQWSELSSTSRTALSAYENERKSPQLSTVERMFESASIEISLQKKIKFRKVRGARGQSIYVPNRLPSPPLSKALCKSELPLHINWTNKSKVFNFRNENDRKRAYELILQNGKPSDINSLVEGKFLVACWEDLVLPKSVKTAWQPLIDEAMAA